MIMKVLFDTNVIIDALTERDLTYRHSKELVRYVISGAIKGFITAKQITDLYYIARNYFSTEMSRRQFIKLVVNTFEVIPTTKSDIVYCLNSKMKDLEDALIDEVYSVNCIDYLVTNNAKDFEGAKSVIITPEQLVTILEVNQ